MAKQWQRDGKTLSNLTPFSLKFHYNSSNTQMIMRHLNLIMLPFFITNLVIATPKTLYYLQQLNHFGVDSILGDVTFQQRYVIDNTYWKKSPNAPFLVYFGGESSIVESVQAISIISEVAPHFGALVAYIEHRFYGASIPYGSIDTAISSPIIRSYLNTTQALADFAKIIVSIKRNMSIVHYPVIVMGSSYSGMLAAWFRLKYPHIAIGALASSAPVLFFEYIAPDNDFCSIVTRDFEHVNRECADRIRQSWTIIEEIAAKSNGLGILTTKFNLCNPLLSTYELKLALARIYTFAAQYNGRFNGRINDICNPIMEVSSILEGVINALFSLDTNNNCISTSFGNKATSPYYVLDDNSWKAWHWQQCSEINYIMGCNGYNPMLPREVFANKSRDTEECLDAYYSLPNSNWVKTYYGGRNMIRSGSNIIFSNGLMDPLSSAGVLEDLSDTIVAIKAKEGSHCLDMFPTKDDDPKWLVKQRDKEIKILEGWINNCSCRKLSHTVITLIMYVFMLGILDANILNFWGIGQ